MIKILIVEDQTMLRDSLQHIIGEQADTEKEIAVIRLVCQGKSRSEMSKELGISESMIKPIITSILDKTGFDSIMKFAVYAVGRGLIVPDW